ncbi:MAG: bifunctional (p)ppGpp synthetase/guanosine-3',5'-bis(diphosphate) 3'-pyrophosphohydrolase [Alphaproteobacteria bacterium]|jgi:(p)ppGpp synthase/HD superfamily hydrolase|nr:bifunctional (p)ppGpp synthetase/guanosine-3',5'-bis(diphosphate) 3'-pyrophosphohydrolase [Alphaproteobacteria bacterium]
MDYSTSCKYSIRLIEKLKLLDTNGVLDFGLINKAIYFAKKYHDGQLRKSGEPFYSHPLEVAYMISDYNLKTDVIAASILHDIVEDTAVTLNMILETFGQRVAEMVNRLTRDRPDGTKLSVKEIIRMAYKNGDKEVLLIKIFDRLHNLQNIHFLTADKQIKVAKETLNTVLLAATYLEDINIEFIIGNIVNKILDYNPKRDLLKNQNNRLVEYNDLNHYILLFKP